MPGEELRCDYGSYYWSVEHASDESRVFRLTGDGIRDVATAQAS
jgi:hypothetical protein